MPVAVPVYVRAPCRRVCDLSVRLGVCTYVDVRVSVCLFGELYVHEMDVQVSL